MCQKRVLGARCWVLGGFTAEGAEEEEGFWVLGSGFWEGLGAEGVGGWIPACAGMTGGGRGIHREGRGGGGGRSREYLCRGAGFTAEGVGETTSKNEFRVAGVHSPSRHDGCNHGRSYPSFASQCERNLSKYSSRLWIFPNLFRVELEHHLAKLQHPSLSRILGTYFDVV